MLNRSLAVSAILLVAGAGVALGHCQIPCGIYTDELRFDMIEEHAATIEKSMTQINELAAGNNPNQLIRWVGNKEEHAEKVQEIVHQYFLTQRIKPVPASDAAYGDYLESLRLCHEMLVDAMKCKQTTDLGDVKRLREAVAAFKMLYFKDKEHDHE
jgi:nickel superoxide dismutase